MWAIYNKNSVFFILVLCAFIMCSMPSYAQIDNKVQIILIAEQEAVIASPIGGRIASIPFHDGDSFNKGDVLAEFDCDVEKAQLDKFEAQREIASATLKAQERLEELNASSKVELLISRAELRKANAEVNEFKSRLNLCTIKAPFSGNVSGRNANAFETIEAGTPLLKIASLDNLQARLLVPSDWLSKIRVGSALDIKIHENGKTYGAHIVRVGGAVDAVSQSISMVAQLDEKQSELLPGMSGEAVFNFDSTEK